MSMSPAARFAGNAVIIDNLYDHLDQTNTLVMMKVKKTFYEIGLSHLYEEITIKIGKPDPFANIELDSNVRNSFEDEKIQKPNINMIKRINFFYHTKSQCPFNIYRNIPILPNLKIINLLRGEIPNSIEYEKELCEYSKCQFLKESCINIKKIIIYQLNFKVLKNFNKLEEIIIKIRPCQAPNIKRFMNKKKKK
ncbi:uncharacterized protein I206_103676 [Kwoniella pini CBS 10737]